MIRGSGGSSSSGAGNGSTGDPGGGGDGVTPTEPNLNEETVFLNIECQPTKSI